MQASLLWCHNGHNSVWNHQPHDRLLNRLFRRRSKKISKLRVTGLCAGNSQGTSEFPAQMASNSENVSIWWRHHDHVHGRMSLRYINHNRTHKCFSTYDTLIYNQGSNIKDSIEFDKAIPKSCVDQIKGYSLVQSCQTETDMCYRWSPETQRNDFISTSIFYMTMESIKWQFIVVVE